MDTQSPDLDTILKKAYTPQPTRPPLNATREIRTLRRLIRQTHRRMDEGTLDFAAGASIITRSSNALARILKTDHHISPPLDQDPWSDLRSFLDRLIALSPEPSDPSTPDPQFL